MSTVTRIECMLSADNMPATPDHTGKIIEPVCIQYATWHYFDSVQVSATVFDEENDNTEVLLEDERYPQPPAWFTEAVKEMQANMEVADA